MWSKEKIKIDDEEIVFADLTNREHLEIIVICKSGKVLLYDLDKNRESFVANLPFNSVPNLSEDFNPFKVLENLSPAELSRLLENQQLEPESIENIAKKNQDLVNSLSLNAKLYSFQDYVCIVQDKGTSGIVLDLTNPNFQKPLKRGDYQVEHCSFPIAFYEKNNQTFLIHGTDWNRLDITCLETNELLTDRIVDYETNSNYFDYFHGSLRLSPDSKYFTSNGWIWHPFGQITLYTIEDLLKNFEFAHQNIELTDEPYDLDWERPLCWVDEKILAVGFNKSIEDYEKTDFPNELLFVDIIENKIINRIEFKGFTTTSEGDVSGELFYDKENSRLIGLNEKTGLFISDIQGNEIFKDSSFTSHKYSAARKLFYRIDNKNQLIETFKL